MDKPDAAFEAVENDLAGREAERAAESASGTFSQEEQAEYKQTLRLTDLLSLLKLAPEEYWAPHVAPERLHRGEGGSG